jgi:hypothetical protein
MMCDWLIGASVVGWFTAIICFILWTHSERWKEKYWQEILRLHNVSQDEVKNPL